MAAVASMLKTPCAVRETRAKFEDQFHEATPEICGNLDEGKTSRPYVATFATSDERPCTGPPLHYRSVARRD